MTDAISPSMPDFHAVAMSDPPSLRRRAPSRIYLTLGSGQAVDISRQCVHLRAGQKLKIQVVLQNLDAQVEINGEEPLLVLVPRCRIISGPGVVHYHAEFIGRSRFRNPFPRTGRLHISLGDGLPDPYLVTIPVTIRPSLWTSVFWWLALFGGLVWMRWQWTIANSQSLSEIMPKLQQDLPFLGGLFLAGFLVVFLLRVIGWLMSLTRPS